MAEEKSPLVQNSIFSPDSANPEQPNTLQQLTKKLEDRGFEKVKVSISITGNLDIKFSIPGGENLFESALFETVAKFVRANTEYLNDCNAFHLSQDGRNIPKVLQYELRSKNKDAAKAYLKSEEIDADEFYRENSRSCCSIV